MSDIPNQITHFTKGICDSHEDIAHIKSSLKKITECVYTIMKHSKYVDNQIRHLNKVQADHNISFCLVHDYTWAPEVINEVQVPDRDPQESSYAQTEPKPVNVDEQT